MAVAVPAMNDPLYREVLRACGINDPKHVKEIHLHWVVNEVTTLEVHFYPELEGLEAIVKKYALVATEIEAAKKSKPSSLESDRQWLERFR